MCVYITFLNILFFHSSAHALMHACTHAFAQVSALFLSYFFLSGGNYSTCNKFLSHLTNLHVYHVVIGCKKTEEWGWDGLKQWHKSHQVLQELVNWFKNWSGGDGAATASLFSFLRMVIWFLQLVPLTAKACSSLESVKQHVATYMIISSMGLMKCAATVTDINLNIVKYSVL